MIKNSVASCSFVARCQRTSFLWRCAALAILMMFPMAVAKAATPSLQIATFQIDATPPLGSPLCNGTVKPVKEIITPLTARGVILLGAGQPIVLCAFDWAGIGNQSHSDFRSALAEAVDTTLDRVTIHTLHQHDAPASDFATEKLLAEHGLGGLFSNAEFDWQVMQRLAKSAQESLATAKPVTHLGLGVGKVERVASNRRLVDPTTQRVELTRMSASRNPKAQAAPEGTIDPLLRSIAFWNDDRPIAVMTYYATHPQSYYGQGSVNWDFVGMARELRAAAIPGIAHIHFNGASGNVAAGKYNDGSKENRPVLAQRLADGMKLAWDSQTKHPLTAEDVRWKVEPVAMPIRDTLNEETLLVKLKDEKLKQTDRLRAGRDLTFLRQTRAGHRIPLTCLQLGPAKVLHMPGELFVEYQLASQHMLPNEFVAMAAYGDYGTGYIGTEIAYSQGGYETGIVSRVAPQVEEVLMNAMQRLLGNTKQTRR